MIGFSTRVQNALGSMGLHDLTELASLTEQDLYRWPNMGRKSVTEIKEQLAYRGLTLGMVFAEKPSEHPDTSSLQAKSLDSIIGESRANRILFLVTASRAGYGSADNHLGVIYLEGVGAPRDYRKARLHFIRAARRGYRLGFWNLALIYRIGYGVRRSEKKAARWMRQYQSVTLNPLEA
jgi:TPR repeat protein